MKNENKVNAEMLSDTADTSATGRADSPSALLHSRFGLDQLLPIVFLLVSAVWIYIGLVKFGYFNKLKGGTPGFLPVTVASVMLVASVVALAKALRNAKGENPRLNLLCIGFLVMCGGIVALSYLIGLILALLIFVFLWLKIIEKNRWKTTIAVTAINAAIGYGVFQLALNVPFPNGLLFRTIFG